MRASQSEFIAAAGSLNSRLRIVALARRRSMQLSAAVLSLLAATELVACARSTEFGDATDVSPEVQGVVDATSVVDVTGGTDAPVAIDVTDTTPVGCALGEGTACTAGALGPNCCSGGRYCESFTSGGATYCCQHAGGSCTTSTGCCGALLCMMGTCH